MPGESSVMHRTDQSCFALRQHPVLDRCCLVWPRSLRLLTISDPYSACFQSSENKKILFWSLLFVLEHNIG